MTGNNRRGMVLQERDRHLLREISLMRVIDREQAAAVGRFGSTTRVNARLLKLTRAGLLRRYFVGTTAGGAKALYSLSEKGGRFMGLPESGPRRRRDEAVVGDFFIQHQLAINEVYCAMKYANHPGAQFFKEWRSFPKNPTAGLHLIPDGYFELATPSGVIAAFLEVDLGHERHKVWREKVKHYLDLAVSGTFRQQFGQERFRGLVVAESERRLDAIRTVVRAETGKIFWFATLESVRAHGFFSPIWRRPEGDDLQPFLRSTS
jgi:Replication-relaxation